MGTTSVLCQGFALSFQQAVACFCPFQLVLHQTQGLASREDWLSALRVGIQVSNLEVLNSRVAHTTAPDMTAAYSNVARSAWMQRN